MDKSFRRKMEKIKKEKLSEKKIVSLDEYRELCKKTEAKTVLVVDDEKVMVAALKKVLSSEGYKVYTASNADEVSDALETIKFDLILLDVNMPWVSGIDICKTVKEHPILRDVPVIFVSAMKAAGDLKEGYDAGCAEYVTKPFDVDSMVDVVKQTLLKSS